jgi:hypothetical protein
VVKGDPSNSNVGVPLKSKKPPKPAAAASSQKPAQAPHEGGDGVSSSGGGEGRRRRARLQQLNQQIAHFGQLKRLNEAVAAFRRISAEGLEPSAHSYASLINAHVRSGDVSGLLYSSSPACQLAFLPLLECHLDYHTPSTTAHRIPPSSLTMAAAAAAAAPNRAAAAIRGRRGSGLLSDGGRRAVPGSGGLHRPAQGASGVILIPTHRSLLSLPHLGLS